MNFASVDFFKDPLYDAELDLSDISDVKSSDLEKVLKSANELDDEIFGGAKVKAKTSDKTVKKNAKKEEKLYDDPLADMGLLSSDEDVIHQKSMEKKRTKEAIANVFGVTSEDRRMEEIKKSPSKRILEEDTKPKLRSSSDWLGLTASPEKPKSDIKPPNSAPSLPNPNTPLRLQDQTKLSLNRSRTEGDLFAKKPSVVPLNSSESNLDESRGFTFKKKSNLLDDLFGSERIKKDEPKTDRKVEFSGDITNSGLSDKKTDGEKTDITYTPSLSSGRRMERKRDTTNLPTLPKLGIAISESDTFMGEDEITGEKNVKRNTPENKQETQVNPVQSKSQRKQSPKLQSKVNVLPEWLGGGSSGKISQLNESSSTPIIKQQTKVSTLETSFPEWLGGNVGEIPPEFRKTKEPEEILQKDEDSSINDTNEVKPPQEPKESQEGNVIGQLANVQAQLGAAMARHNQNLQTYMQALMNEAQRVAIGSQMVIIQDKVNEVPEDNKKMELKIKIEEKEQYIKEQADVIFDLQTKITSQELQIAQLEMRVKNIEEIKNMEIEKFKKEYEFEISIWEKRIDRTKSSYEEIISEYENKISRLKQKEEETEKEFEKRIESLENERKNDLEKLGEFHRLAMEQTAMISIPPNLSSGIRIPLRYPAKPGDDVELTERESALLQKERNIEILKATLEADKRDLDEALEREKLRQEEREREVKRTLMEIKMREEFNSKEYERKTEQLKQQEERLKAMREEALKEQNQLSKDKLSLAAEKAKLEAMISIQSDPNAPNLHPMDLMKARAELEAALEAARDARDVADQERRRHIELRKTIEEISWEQKDKDQQLDMRERHITYMIKDAENKKAEGLTALEEAQNLKEELEQKQRDITETLKHIETKEKVLTKERLEIAKERLELDKRKSQLELLLPELSPAEDLTINSTLKQPSFVDPKAVIMRLKAEKDLQDYIAPLRKNKEK